jgi:hypothetical protein
MRREPHNRGSLYVIILVEKYGGGRMNESTLTSSEFMVEMMRLMVLFEEEDTRGKHEYFDDWKTDFDNFVKRMPYTEGER